MEFSNYSKLLLFQLFQNFFLFSITLSYLVAKIALCTQTNSTNISKLFYGFGF